MTTGDLVLPLAQGIDPVHYVVIDDEPRYRLPIEARDRTDLLLVGSYGTVDDFLDVQCRPCHVVVLDLCLNRQTGDAALLQGVRAIRQLTEEYGHRVLVHTADARPEPVARCVAAGAAGYVSKYVDSEAVAAAIAEVGRTGRVITAALNDALRELVLRSRDVRLSSTLEETLTLLDKGLPDAEIARRRQLSLRTIEDHKYKILDLLCVQLGTEKRAYGELRTELGVGPGDVVNDLAGHRPARGAIERALAWLLRPRQGH